MARRKFRKRSKAKDRSSLGLMVPSVAIVCMAVVLYLAWSPAGTRQRQVASTTVSTAVPERPLEFKAAIIDQLAIFSPESAFVEEARKTLTSAGFTVRHYAPREVTVDFYRKLPSLGYRLIVLRVHSAVSDDGGVYPFTSEPYSESEYPFEQLMGYVGKGSVTKDPPYYFAISPSFVTYGMEGNFRGAIIILSTCHGLCSPKLADRLIQRGASVVVGWDGLVDLPHTDKATVVLLKALVKGFTVMQAVEDVMKEVGPDPQYGSLLRYYPPKSGRVNVWNVSLPATLIMERPRFSVEPRSEMPVCNLVPAPCETDV